MNRESGIVKWWNAPKGFGFIVPFDKTQRDLFAHHSCIARHLPADLQEGQVVTYVVETSMKGAQACDIRYALTQELR